MRLLLAEDGLKCIVTRPSDRKQELAFAQGRIDARKGRSGGRVRPLYEAGLVLRKVFPESRPLFAKSTMLPPLLMTQLIAAEPVVPTQ